jgi:dTMP kinase
MFITFEGMDGSGKTTQVRQTVAHLRMNGLDVLAVREPGGTGIGNQIRTILLDEADEAPMSARAELLLFCASRAQLVSQVIMPHLENGGVVISDRYIDSTYAYQGYGHGLNLKALKQVNTFATGGLLPDVTLFLDIDPHAALKRRAQGTLFGEDWNRLDDMDLSFHERVYRGYRDLMLAEPARFVAIDGRPEPDTVQAAIRSVLAEWLPLRKADS